MMFAHALEGTTYDLFELSLFPRIGKTKLSSCECLTKLENLNANILDNWVGISVFFVGSLAHLTCTLWRLIQ